MKVDFEGSGPAYKSYMGACVSITFIVLSSIFLYIKISTIYNDSHVSIFSTIAEGALHQSDKFTSKQGLFVAAAITAYDNETELPADLEKYGELIF